MNFLFDIKYALRMLLNKPQFTIITTLVMAVGLGLSIYMIAFLSNLIYKDLPVKNGEHLYIIQATFDGKRQGTQSISLPDFSEIKQASRSYEHIGALSQRQVILSNGDNSSRYSGTYVTSNIFEYFSQPAKLGRTFNEQDLIPGASPVVVLTHQLWKDYFQQHKNIIGETVQINGVMTEVIGVMPPGKDYPVRGDLWLPANDNILRVKRNAVDKVAVYVHKKADVSLEQANAEVAGIMKRIEQQYPETNSGVSAKLHTLPEAELGDDFDIMKTLMTIAVMLVLILSCINVGNLLLTRANERSKETAIRLALGAPRTHLIIQMMWESILICFLGGIVGLLGAAYCLEFLNQTYSDISQGNAAYWWYNQVDINLILKALALTLFTALITGIVPAWKMTQCNVNSELRDGTRGAVGKKSGRISRILVITEVTLSCILLILASAVYMMLAEGDNIDYGADIENRLQVRTNLPNDRYKTTSEKIQFFQRLMPELEKVSGGKSVGSISTLPGNGTRMKEFEPEGYEITDHKYPKANRVVSYTGSMKNLEMKLLEGRYFDSRDIETSQSVAIITEGLAKQYWPNDTALGKRIQFKQGNSKKDAANKWLTVVGVIKHVTFSAGLGPQQNIATVFQPYSQEPYRNMSNFMTLNKNSGNKINEISAVIGKVDPFVPTFQVMFISDMIQLSQAGMSLIMGIFTVFAIAALFLAASGIYGVMSNSTSRRTQELGIRRALGSTDESIMKLLMKQGWWQLAIGLLFGLPLGFLASQGFVRILQPQTTDYYFVYLVIPVIITVVVLFSTYFPAKKAIELEPGSALRYE